MRRVHRNSLLTGLITALLITSAYAQMCKWVDENGVVHYAQTCPEGVETERIEIEEPAQPHEQAQSPSSPYLGLDPDTSARSLSLQRLGPPPEFTQSRYLVTSSALMRDDEASLGGQFIIRLRATDRLPSGALLEARFPDPSRPGQATHESFVYEGLSPMIRLASRPATGFQCWNYHVIVSVYSDATKAELLDTHEQIVQSRFDLSDIRTAEDFAKATSGGGNCQRGARTPAAPDYSSMTAQQLDAECERAREELLKPEREALIQRCKTTEGKDPAWCELYYSDYGAAQRQGNFMRPPKYSDIPVCRAAREAWQR
jgi:hypothetical protein